MKDLSKIVIYAKEDLRGGFIYDGYRPKLDELSRVANLLPRAHVIVVSADWCKDCRREVPKFARLLDHLPDWTVELRGDDDETRQVLGVRAIPTFVVQNPETGAELGRIIESPALGSLEGDLLEIAQCHPIQIVV